MDWRLPQQMFLHLKFNQCMPHNDAVVPRFLVLHHFPMPIILLKKLSKLPQSVSSVYTLVNYHSNGKWTLWRWFSSWKCGYSIALLLLPEGKLLLKNCLTPVTSLLGTGSLVVPRGKWPFISSCTNPRRVYRSRKWEKFGWTDGLLFFMGAGELVKSWLKAIYTIGI